MALKSSNFARVILYNGTWMVSSASSKIHLSTTSTLCRNQVQYEFSLLQSIRQIHRTSNKNNGTLSPWSVLSSSHSQKDKITDDPENDRNSLDHMVNSYPASRKFIAIGSGGDDFADAMVFAVESVLQQAIPPGSVRKRVSSMGRYISVNIGPVQVISRDQVKAVYETMMKDVRMRYFF